MIRSIGTTATVLTANRVMIYSGILRRWTVLPVGPSAVVTTNNAYVIIEDGASVHGWASRIGKVETLSVSATRKVLPGPASANWVTLVHDGTKVYGFSAFKGKWAPLTVGNATPTIVVHQLGAVVHDRVKAYGFSVYHGTWVPTVAPGTQVSLQGAGVVGMANSPTLIRGFAARTNTWSTRAVASTANVTMGRGYALVTSGKTVTAFSGYRGNFASFAAANTVFTTTAKRNIATIVDGNTVAAYAATQGTFQTIRMTSPTVLTNSEVAVASSTVDRAVVGFSGVTGKFSSALHGGPWTVSIDETAAFAQGSPFSAAYSPILNTWVRAPSVSITQVTTLRNSIILTHPGGFTGFSARYAKWMPLAASSAATLNGPRRGRGATLVITDRGKMHAWDSRLGRWATVTTALTPNLAIFRTVALGEDGNTGYGFGLMQNVWDTIQLQGKVTVLRSSSSIGYIQTTNHLHIFSAHGSLSTLSRFPEFSRFQLTGTNLRLIQVAPARSFVAGLLGLAPGLLQSSFGTLFLDPLGPIFPLALPVVPADGRLDFTLPVPNDPSLSGRALHIQNLIVPPNGLPYLTNSTSPVIV
ncbi:MAG: hypothetical protein ACE5F1_12155 [Planctomycetota bacterium]